MAWSDVRGVWLGYVWCPSSVAVLLSVEGRAQGPDVGGAPQNLTRLRLEKLVFGCSSVPAAACAVAEPCFDVWGRPGPARPVPGLEVGPHCWCRCYRSWCDSQLCEAGSTPPHLRRVLQRVPSPPACSRSGWQLGVMSGCAPSIESSVVVRVAGAQPRTASQASG